MSFTDLMVPNPLVETSITKKNVGETRPLRELVCMAPAKIIKEILLFEKL